MNRRDLFKVLAGAAGIASMQARPTADLEIPEPPVLNASQQVPQDWRSTRSRIDITSYGDTNRTYILGMKG